jgi:hypothetical protein
MSDDEAKDLMPLPLTPGRPFGPSELIEYGIVGDLTEAGGGPVTFEGAGYS